MIGSGDELSKSDYPRSKIFLRTLHRRFRTSFRTLWWSTGPIDDADNILKRTHVEASFNYKEAELEDSDVAGTAGGSVAAATNTRRKRMAAGVGGNGEAREKGGSRRGKSLNENSERGSKKRKAELGALQLGVPPVPPASSILSDDHIHCCS